MKPYRIKHKASGLYYQPTVNGSNLSKTGKVYLTKNKVRVTELCFPVKPIRYFVLDFFKENKNENN